MAKIGTFGTIRFKVSDQQLLTFQNFKREIAGSWSNMERIGKKPLTVFSGPELQTISFRVFLDAGLGIPPREMLEKIEDMVELGTAHYLIIGNQQVGNQRWVITKSSEIWDKILVKGELFRATVDLTLQEYV